MSGYAHSFGFPADIGEMDLEALLDMPEELDGATILGTYDRDGETWSVTYGTGMNWDEYTEIDADRDGGEDHVAEANIPGIPVFVDDPDTDYRRDGSTQPSFTPPIGGREGVYNVHDDHDDGARSGFNGLMQKLTPFEALKYRHRERSYDTVEADAGHVTAYPADHQHIVDEIAASEDASILFVTASGDKHDTGLERNPGYVLKILPGVLEIDERLEKAAEDGLSVQGDFAQDFMETTHDEALDARIAEEYGDVEKYARDLVAEVQEADDADTLRDEFETALPLAERWLDGE